MLAYWIMSVILMGENGIYNGKANFRDLFYVLYMREIGKKENFRRKEDGRYTFFRTFKPGMEPDESSPFPAL
jgi:hypothetical protein